MGHPRDYTGMKRGKLTYLHSTDEYSSTGRVIWAAQCDCGRIAYIPTSNISQNRSCGCMLPSSPHYIPISAHRYTYTVIKVRHNAKYIGDVLTYEQYAPMASARCTYCKSPPNNSFKGTPYQGIDRVDNDRGYTVDNCVPCCDKCNSFKSAYHIDEFFEHVLKIADAIRSDL